MTTDGPDRIYFPDGEYTTVIMRARGVDLTIDLREIDFCQGEKPNGNERLELLAWAQLKATRQQAEQLAKLAAAVTQLGLGAHDQAAAVREQTATMQRNIDEAKAAATSPEDVFDAVSVLVPKVLAKLGDNDAILQMLGLDETPTTVKVPSNDAAA